MQRARRGGDRLGKGQRAKKQVKEQVKKQVKKQVKRARKV
jgi:hypothetical protein